MNKNSLRNKNTLRNSVATTAILTALSLANPAIAADVSSDYDFHIKAQSLEDALIDFSAQSGVQVVASSKLISGFKTASYAASGPADDALGNLLQSTGLTYVIKGDEVVTILAASDENPAYQPISMNSGAYYENNRTVYDAADEKDADEELDEILVVGKKYYRHKSASSGTKMNMALKDTAQSIKVITADVIEAASLRSFEDIYKIDASGGTSHANDGFPRNYYRGFRQQGDDTIKVDGFRFTANLDLDLSVFERFEVIKGPTSTLYGATGIGGSINAVSKKPQEEFALEISGEIGTYDSYRADLDVTGSLTEDGSITYRLITAYEDEGSFYEYGDSETFVFAPSVKFQLADETSITVNVNYQNQEFQPHFGSPFIRPTLDEDAPNYNAVVLADLPRSFWYGQEWNNSAKDAILARTTLEHVFDSGWNLRANFQYTNVQTLVGSASTELAGADGVPQYVSLYAEDEDLQAYAAEINLFGDVEAFGQEHTLFLGVDYFHKDEDSLFGFTGGPDHDLNIFTPDYANIPKPETLSDYTYIYDVNEKDTEFGATVQLVLRPTDKLSLTFGGRYSYTKTFEEESFGETVAEAFAGDYEVTRDNITVDKFTKQVSLVYAITDDINFYAMYGETFEPSFRRTETGGLVPPQEGSQYEAGIKGDIGEGMSFSFSAFETKRFNIAERPRGERFYIPVGAQRTKGLELDISGELFPNFNVIGSFAILDAEYIEGNLAGFRPANAPKFGASVFAGYQFDEGSLEGLGFGVGFVYKTGLEVFDDDLIVNDRFYSFNFGDTFELDARIFYEQDNWEIALSATNLGNTLYYSPSFDELEYGIHPNPPREVRLSFTYKFF